MQCNIDAKGKAPRLWMGVELEALESRTHLAAAPISAYYPLQPGWEWVYRDVEDGKRSTRTETILPGTLRVHGERAFQRLGNDDAGITLENVGASGKVQVHRFKDDSVQMTFNPPWVYPKLAQVGQRSAVEGVLDIAISSGNLHLKGKFSVAMRVVKMERVRVAAGTFSTVKIQLNLDTSFGYKFSGRSYSLHATATGYQWLAKGVGIVKDAGTSHSEENDDGRRKVEDSTSKGSLQSFTRPGL